MSSKTDAIVCIDDDLIILRLLEYQLREIFQDSNVLIETFSKPLDFISSLDLFAENNINITYVLVDFKMPVMNGADLIRKVKPKIPKTKFIMISGQANNEVILDLKKNGLLDSFISKPWKIEQLQINLTSKH